MTSQFRPAATILVLLTVLTGAAYPALVTGVTRIAFRDQAAGSLVIQDGKVRGSRLIGQAFTSPQYVWGRPSATGPMPDNAAGSSGSNQGPLNPALLDAVKGRIDALRAADPDNGSPVPVDLVTASASGLDPHISPAAALYQAGRVAKARGIDRARVEELVHKHTEHPLAGFLGEERVNVLALNLDLDQVAPAK
ncbi:potassium-transporting ATPase subunit KdpC [uncultured Massilia sp.]|uniref:potassium-transporting ATPase subunit KdpC n=1 Tax=uncultured Massilia sp. TaxID=169973 RepID=UPI0025F66453|nr:potassium-transporting ATPase subunit KdpC [uncultured Massilia sp.]